jgi:cephalosporin hydroxylase
VTRQQQIEQMLGIETHLDVAASWATFDTDEYYLKVQGVHTWKLKDDLNRYALVIERTRPDLIIEVGTKWGGSALWFADFGIDVVTVDIDQSLTGPAHGFDVDREQPHIQFVEGDSVNLDTLARVSSLASGYERVMVSLDGEHAAPHVYHEILAYGPMVSQGCYLVVEDGIFDLVDPSVAHRGGARIPTEGGPLAAIRQAGLHTDPRWVRDVEVERLTLRSYHPAGFWRRAEVD